MTWQWWDDADPENKDLTVRWLRRELAEGTKMSVAYKPIDCQVVLDCR